MTTMLTSFGHERTPEECLTRASWERSAAEHARTLPYGEIAAQAHEQTAKAYEDLANQKREQRFQDTMAALKRMRVKLWLSS
jgi:hypothetical protein